MTESIIVRVVNQYMAAWNTADAGIRNGLLRDCWSERGNYIDPTVVLAGRDALAMHIAQVQSRRPGAKLEFMSGVDVHHNVVRFLWRLVRADGTAGETSIDFGEIGSDLKLTKIVGFFGAVPMLPK
ncbi:hypothetical protein [Bradyrhizobium icense]|uniref:Nuclear transport factor 2 family protein n=1 Tax=Bradyrhizobium icense TaxID=1274631 RepID=A0A1B1UBJ8_9BRAD|nr:hypothetical protein [Bradyrhizobium icense]ANW00147.1 hypothetical protein LMTR13_08090 [Bradyrhizobium icense]